MARPSTYEEAREHIEAIRKSRGVNKIVDRGELTGDQEELSSLVRILSEELYSKQHHFLFELLQNADDNMYDAGVIPHMTICYSETEMTVTTNEKGFRKDDVNSLYRAGISTKRGQRDTIGEKGIGFKSVFKFAKIAEIWSGHYRFRFDTGPPLNDFGMVVPSWVNTPASERPKNGLDGSRLTLTFRKETGKDWALLKSQLGKLDPTCLLFTRKLKQIHIKDIQHDHDSETSSGFYRESHAKRLDDYDGDALTIITKTCGITDTLRYICYDYVVSDMPKTKKRLGQAQTTITFAFPYRNRRPYIKPQQVFAFLPIREYGYKFLIHADFILTANREDIAPSLAWNKHLCNHICESLIDAFDRLSNLHESTREEESEMSYGWPQYLEGLDDLDESELDCVGANLKDGLKDRKILISETGHREKPKRLKIVQKRYRFYDGSLLLDLPGLAESTLSQKYPKECHKGLSYIGVTNLTSADFFESFQEFVSQNDGADYRNMPQKWHSAIARVLLLDLEDYGPKSRQEKLSRYSKLPIIPLQNDTWTAKGSNEIFFPVDNDVGDGHKLKGIDFSFVEKTAASDVQRYDLFWELGIKSCTREEICLRILQFHNKAKIKSSLRSCISHALYLFHSDHEPQAGERLAVFNDASCITRSTAVYVPFGEAGRLVRDLLPSGWEQFPRLHPDYEKAVRSPDLESWMKWLLKWPQVTDRPSIHSSDGISPGMLYIHKTHGSKVFLDCLRQMQEELDELKDSSPRTLEQLTEQISLLEVAVLGDTGKTQLKNTALPSLEKYGQSLLKILDLDDPQKDWTFLKSFGVLCFKDSALYLRVLREMRVKPSHPEIRKIYRAMGDCAVADKEEAEKLREAFKEERLIFTKDSSWVFPSECVWNCNFECTRMPILAEIYSNCRELFSKVLRIPDGNIDTIIEEFASHRWQRSRKAVINLLLALDGFLDDSEVSEKTLKRLKKVLRFPTCCSKFNAQATKTNYVATDAEFWIADRLDLYERFEGKIEVLHLDARYVSKLDHLFKTLDIESKRLSRCVRERVEYEGEASLDDDETAFFQTKVPFILGILCKDGVTQEDYQAFKIQLDSTRVYCAPKMVLKSFLKKGDKEIKGAEVDGEAIVKVQEEGINIYVAASDTSPMTTKYEVADQLNNILSISNSRRGLLAEVIVSNNHKSIRRRVLKIGIYPIEEGSSPILSCQTSETEHTEDDDIEGASDRGSDNIVQEAVRTLPKTPAASPRTKTLRDLSKFRRSFGKGEARDPIPISSPNRQARVSSPLASSPFAKPISSKPSVEYFDEDASEGNLLMTDDRRPNSLITRESIQRVLQCSGLVDFSPIVNQVLTTMETNEDSSNVFSTTALLEALPSSPSPAIRASPPATPKIRIVDTVGIRSASRSGSSAGLRRSSVFSKNLSPSRKTPSPIGRPVSPSAHTELWHAIGFHGELFVYKFLLSLPKSTPFIAKSCWTSNNRNRAFPENPFKGLEKNFSDFTFSDSDGILGDYLVCRGLPSRLVSKLGGGNSAQQQQITYHLEVKSTTEGSEEAFYMSDNQIQQARAFAIPNDESAIVTDVYIVLRVYDLAWDDEVGANMRMYIDPWNLIHDGQLEIHSPESFVIKQPRPDLE